MAKQRTLHVFSDNGKSVQVSLQVHKRRIPIFEAAQEIAIGVYGERDARVQQLLSISVEGPEESGVKPSSSVQARHCPTRLPPVL